jgi:hypothetical protein
MHHRDEKTKESTSDWTVPFKFLSLLFLASALPGCLGVQERYVEKHVIKNLTLVFLDEHSLHEQWKQTVGSEAVRFQPQMNSTVPLVHTVKGFYDFTSNTLYCPKWNFEVCGHELHHAALGHFHPSN